MENVARLMDNVFEGSPYDEGRRWWLCLRGASECFIQFR